MSEITKADFPEHGYMAYQDDIPIAASFLRKCEGNYAIIDSLITDPGAPSDKRHDAIDLITGNLISLAKDLGFKSLLCFSIDDSTIARARRHGFTETNHVTMGRNL